MPVNWVLAPRVAFRESVAELQPGLWDHKKIAKERIKKAPQRFQFKFNFSKFDAGDMALIDPASTGQLRLAHS